MSPDSQWVGFFEGNLFRKAALAGGPVLTIAEYPRTQRSAAWGPDDTIILGGAAATSTSAGARGLSRVNANGGVPEALTTPDAAKGEQEHLFPEFLPGGKAILFTITTTDAGVESAQVALLDLDTRRYRVLIRGGTNPRFVGSGHILYTSGGTLFAVPFDTRRLDVHGAPVPVIEHVVTKANGAASFSVSRNGTLAYISGLEVLVPSRTLVWVDRQGREEAAGPPARS